MALRMMVYVGLLYQALIKQGQLLSDDRLPPVLPIVFYNGGPRWSAATDVFHLIPPVPGLVEQFKPHFSYLLVDENAYTDSQLASLKHLVAAVFHIEHPVSPEAIGDLIALLDEWLVDRPGLRRMFAVWIRATLMRKGEYRILLPEIDDLQELKVMLAERLEEWAQGYEARGEARGEEKGEAIALQRLLVRRYGVLPPDLASRIAAASREEIETWLDRVLDARSLEDVFGPTEH
ncbi:MAG: Rpn family recombination-promoting nuclease/putative transposase [Candidatus Accumulibacter sp.]|uniref:Rpn family recombination-promoting nuclease/putative transposase n=1 Tax=Accumulibacter sp. TaxID=2053492 RepID=UPI00258D4638|nr:Rpn family recombination-promoting nuclease/putative transposase [Accumulibacter sp.]MCM8622040.1 Rpn family recombination-promoting nuclease/putative transposase [Accumulibacter sp.]